MKPETSAVTGDTSTTADSGAVVTGDSALAAPGTAPASVDTVETDQGTVRVPPKPARPPRRRAPRLDELLANAVDQARAALEGVAEGDQVGDHVGAVADDDRLVTHRFAARLPGYGGWEWFSTLARAPRSKVVTVCEVGLLPGANAILAPDWVPWSERVSQEEKIRLDAIAAGEDPEKALARFRGETEDDGDAGTADDGTDEADVDTGSDAADADAGAEAHTGAEAADAPRDAAAR